MITLNTLKHTICHSINYRSQTSRFKHKDFQSGKLKICSNNSFQNWNMLLSYLPWKNFAERANLDFSLWVFTFLRSPLVERENCGCGVAERSGQINSLGRNLLDTAQTILSQKPMPRQNTMISAFTARNTIRMSLHALKCNVDNNHKWETFLNSFKLSWTYFAS